jgi:deoxyribose-phosphate aldolase
MPSMPPLPPVEADDAQVRAFLEAQPPIDADEVTERSIRLSLRGVPGSRAEAVETAIRLTDLTTLEGTDTPERVRDLCASAVHPDPQDMACPAVAAVCVYSDLAAAAVDTLQGTGVRVASVAAAFPSGRAPLPVRIADVAAAVQAGADEIDLVLDRGALLEGRYADVLAQLRALRSAAATTRLKVILETAELSSLDRVRSAAWLAMVAGADMVKTSTGKASRGATLPDVLVMVEAALAYEQDSGRRVGVKASGGVRTASDALGYLSLVAEVAGTAWLVPERFRFGASSLLGDLVRERGALRNSSSQ